MESFSPRVTSVDSWDPRCGVEEDTVLSEDVDTGAGKHRLVWNIAHFYSSSGYEEFLSDFHVESDISHGGDSRDRLCNSISWHLNMEYLDKEANVMV